MSDNDTTIDLEPADLEAAAKIQGSKLGILLAESLLPDELKDELITLSEKMSEEQLDELSAVLEAEFLDEATREIDEKFQKRLENLMLKYQSEDQEDKKEWDKQAAAIESLGDQKI